MKLASDIGGAGTGPVYLDETTGGDERSRARFTPPHRFSSSADGQAPVTIGNTSRSIASCDAGWGNPNERKTESMRTGQRAGSISAETARDVYGRSDEKV